MQIERYMGRISGPLLDRIDLHIEEQSVPYQELAAKQGLRRVSKHDAFAEGWVVETIEPSRFEVRPDLQDITFSEGGPKAWFVVVRRA
jgi:hypothetical protein